ncbi:MAG: PKD domain-containing protein, partial [Bacteroidota bacterium]
GLECSDTAFVFLDVHPRPQPYLSYEYDTCQTGPVQFYSLVENNKHPIVSYRWDFGDSTTSAEALPMHQYVNRGSYPVQLEVEDAMRCTGRQMERVSWQPQPELPYEPPLPAEGCAPLTVIFDQLEGLVDSSYEVTWEFGDGTVEDVRSPTHVYEQAGSYDLELSIVSPAGCELSQRFPEWIVVENPPIAAFEYLPKGPIRKKDAIQLQNRSEGYDRSEWTFSDGHISTEVAPYWHFDTPGSYSVSLRVTSSIGCEDSTTQLVEVQPVFDIFVPNAFSPNGDDVNDRFRAYVYCPLQDFELKVFDRWGQQLFESSDVEIGWDGRLHGIAYEPGVYAWVISFWADGQQQVLSGDVTLVK